MNIKELLKECRNYIEHGWNGDEPIIAEIDQALAAIGEPVATVMPLSAQDTENYNSNRISPELPVCTKLYPAPPALSDEEISKLARPFLQGVSYLHLDDLMIPENSIIDFARAIQKGGE